MTKLTITGKVNGVYACCYLEVGDLDWIAMNADDCGKAEKNAMPIEITEINIATETRGVRLLLKTIGVWATAWRGPKRE